MTSSLNTHYLTDQDLAALAMCEYSADIVGRLRAAQCSKHALFLEALGRAVHASRPQADVEQYVAARDLLVRVQTQSPQAAGDVLALPHTGFWAAYCLSRLRSNQANLRSAAPELSSLDLGYLATLAAVAALRAGHSFDLEVPFRDGMIALPGLGTARVGSPGSTGWARLRSDSRRTVAVSGTTVADLPADLGGLAQTGANWAPVPRLRVEACGLSLVVTLDATDPFLTLLQSSAVPQSMPSWAWQQKLADAWLVLARVDRRTALALSGALTTLVPLREPAAGGPASASSGWAWGAIALSLPRDPLSLAETLVHELQHLVLSAVEDLVPLVQRDEGQLYYAPWRDDPRPLTGLLQGAYAYLGVAGMWRRLQQTGHEQSGLRTEVEFARWRRSTEDVAASLAGAAGLSKAGRKFVAWMQSCVARWQSDPVSSRADAVASELAAEHRLRWRLAYLHPDSATVDALARAWLAGLPSAFAGLQPRLTLSPTARPLPPDLAHLLELEYRPSSRLTARLPEQDAVDSAAAALVRGDDASALHGFLRQVAAGWAPQAWAGLMLTRRRMAGRVREWPVREEPETAAAVYERARTLIGHAGDARALLSWLGQDW